MNARNFRLADNCVRCDNCQRDDVLDRLVCTIDKRVLITTHNVCDEFVIDQRLKGERKDEYAKTEAPGC